MRPSDVLITARSVLTPPTAWIKRDLARRSDGLSVDIEDPDACQFCLYGAIHFSAPNYDISGEAITIVRMLVPDGGISRFNDDIATTHADVLHIVDKAIVLALSKE